MATCFSALGLSDGVSLLLRTCLNSTIVDLRLNENKIRSVHYSSLSRFGNLTYLNLTKNDISYVEDGAFSAQFNLQVGKKHYLYCLQTARQFHCSMCSHDGLRQKLHR